MLCTNPWASKTICVGHRASVLRVCDKLRAAAYSLRPVAPRPLGSGSKFCIPVLTGLWTGFDVISVHTTRSGSVEGVGVEGFAGSGIWALHQSLRTSPRGVISRYLGLPVAAFRSPSKKCTLSVFYFNKGGKLIVSRKATAFGTSLHQFGALEGLMFGGNTSDVGVHKV